MRINKINLMFHPACWAAHGDRVPAGEDEGLWLACLGRERRCNQAQKAYMDSMGADEVLILFPIGSSPAMVDIEDHAARVLGRRCVVVSDVAVRNPPAAWDDLDNPIGRFLDDDRLEGKAEWLAGVPAEIHAELVEEIRQARSRTRGPWRTSVLKVLYVSRLFARDIAAAMVDADLRYDPATVEAVAFGEGFEQCAMTWKAMTVPYLGLRRPAENVFELSVSGARCLVGATFRERLALDHDVRLFLWEGGDGRSVALYARAWCRLRDPQCYATVDLRGLSAEIHNVAGPCRIGEDPRLLISGSRLRVPILNAIRRDVDDDSFYIVTKGTDYDGFRRRLLEAPITAE
ncbi:MAG: hypothetical protein GXY33_22365 [Phycisphaerae bacterium]|nr:hypothetical protein [Phycisphaerae bacterium]